MSEMMPCSANTDFPLVNRLFAFIRPLSLFATLYGLSVLIGHVASIEILYQPWMDAAATSKLTALSIVCLGFALYQNRTLEFNAIVQVVLSLLVLVITVIAIVENLSGSDFFSLITFAGDLVRDEEQSRIKNPMGVNTAILLYTLSFSVLFYTAQYYFISQFMAITAAFIPFASIVGHLYGYTIFHGDMSVVTAVVGLFLSFATIALTADKLILAAILSPHIAGKVARCQIIAGYLFPILLGYVFLHFFGASRPELVSLFAISTCWLIHMIVGSSAMVTEHENAQRRANHNDLRKKTNELESILTNLPVGVMRLARNLDYLYVNRYISENAKVQHPL